MISTAGICGTSFTHTFISAKNSVDSNMYCTPFENIGSILVTAKVRLIVDCWLVKLSESGFTGLKDLLDLNLSTSVLPNFLTF